MTYKFTENDVRRLCEIPEKLIKNLKGLKNGRELTDKMKLTGFSTDHSLKIKYKISDLLLVA